MPVNYQAVQTQIHQMGEEALPRAREITKKLETATATLQTHASDLAALIARVDAARAENSNLRCARPVAESLNANPDAPALTSPYVLLAADGSQVVPSHHDAVEFGVINVGALRVLPGQRLPPQEKIETRLLCNDEIFTRDGAMLTEEIVALMRDIEERSQLAKLAAQETLPVVALTDGQMEIFGAAKASREYQEKLEKYTGVLEQLAGLNVIMAGYVDRPASDLVVRLLELMLLPDAELKFAGERRPLRGVTDRRLFEKFLKPGQRSAIFAIQSSSAVKFSELLAPHFFYLNVGSAARAALARVETPGWVARDEALVDLLHFSLVSQCRELGSHPYPYALHRAHEVALVSLEEKRELLNMLLIELRRRGLPVEEITNKQYLKENWK